MKINNIYFIVIVVIAINLVSCDSKRVYDSYDATPNQTWNKEKKMLFDFEVTDTITKNNLFINIRNNENYAFSNLFLITQLDFPNGKKIVDTLEYEMADASGRFLGNGTTSIKESKLFYKENVVFPLKGRYSFSVVHAMRKNGETDGIENLKGITEVGFRIEKKEND